MIKKYNRRPIAFAELPTNKHAFVGIVWPIASSRGKEKYSVEMHKAGFTCDCIGFTMRGKCKHILSVVNLISCDNYQRYRQYDLS